MRFKKFDKYIGYLVESLSYEEYNKIFMMKEMNRVVTIINKVSIWENEIKLKMLKKWNKKNNAVVSIDDFHTIHGGFGQSYLILKNKLRKKIRKELLNKN